VQLKAYLNKASLLFSSATFLVLFVSGEMGIYSTVAVSLWVWHLMQFFNNSNDSFAFREFFLVLYGMNFLFSPALSYANQGALQREMRIPEDEYFLLAIPGMILLQLGVFLYKGMIFRPDFTLLKISAFLNARVLKFWVVAGIGITFVQRFASSDLAFILYLLSSIRYVGAFGLFILNKKKSLVYLAAVFGIQMFDALVMGMFHDAVMWIIFFGILWIYLVKPKPILKIALFVVGVGLYFILQISKSDYRNAMQSGSSGAGTFVDIIQSNLGEEGGAFNEENYTSSVYRVNQAWIFASTVANMESTGDFQGLNILYLYLEAALLPRFMAPDKLTAGNKEIFNKFSGHVINENTTMALGIFSDGYIAYGRIGVFIFAFAFGCIFSIVFKIVESWAKISPFFILFMLPILHYAVRPDCELQTVLGHLVKGLLIFGVLMLLYKRYFHKQINVLIRTIGKKEPSW